MTVIFKDPFRTAQ